MKAVSSPAHSATRVGEVYDLKLESESKPIGVTATHPFWSVDREAWVSAIDLEIGERLKTLAGTTGVESRTKRQEPETVYNIEVEGDHVYRVGESGVLVHNNSPSCQQYIQTLQTQAASSGSSVDATFQRDECGRTEYKIEGGGESIWADGIEENGCVVLDCKAVRDPNNSPQLGTATQFFENMYRQDQMAELRRYEAVISDNCNPLTKLRIVVNNQDAQPFWRSLLQNLSIQWDIVVR